ncbi:hypothetical protein PPYR_12839 [Photinus pyralis]|uniref:PPPDE domain-containing protein n=2 Tax=Photinus pyralis TaxID=7054 RepID=A0A1Y1KMR9_PHOPY|nr:uncharacterized protein LOC116177848 isoform X2 [Photinus pyralis]KAB0793219.1 hypothetical protein PPYR_12839 [Photinus pyralis]
MTYKVEVYIYDLSRGVAAMVSPLLIGKRIDGVWHTSIVVYGREYFFGSQGVESCSPGSTAVKNPLQIETLGETQIPYTIFIDYLSGLSETSYAIGTYDLLRHNCNNFSQELAQFLCGANIPRYILDLPNEVLQSKLSPALQILVQQLEHSARPISNERSPNHRGVRKDPSPEFLQIEEARSTSQRIDEKRNSIKDKLVKKERKKEKKRKKLLREGLSVRFSTEVSIMADTDTINSGEPNQLPSEQALQFEEDERRQEEERKRSREPPIVFRDLVDTKGEYEVLANSLQNQLSEEEQRALDELRQYMLCDEGSWVVGDGFLNFIGRLLNDRDVQNEVRIHVLNILAAAALKDDVILVLHQDRKDHVLMNYAYEIDRISVDEQLALALFIANMFENLSSSEWLLYISEWTYNGQPISNIRVTTKVAVHSLLSDVPDLQDRGSAIIYNMACKEVKSVVFDDVAVELTMALLQYFNTKPSEEQLWRCMKSLAKFTQISGQDVPQLIQMIGPNPTTFRGTSSRIDEQIDLVLAKMR